MIPAGVFEELKNNKITYETDYDLKPASSFRIGGKCALAVLPTTEEEMIKAVSLLDRAGVRLHIIGRGSNTLFADGHLDLAIILTEHLNKETVCGEWITAGAGASLMHLSSRAAEESLCGLEFAFGIPGSVSGGVYMNAGAYGGTMSDVITESRAYDRKSGKIITLTDHSFGYRTSIYKQNKELVCLSATLVLRKGDSTEIRARMKEYMDARRAKQPLEYPSAGSYFKRPQGDFAGRLIEVCGLKGFSIGGAAVSEKHAGFIINRGGAAFDDVMRLEEQIIEKVLRDTGVSLEREVEIIR